MNEQTAIRLCLSHRDPRGFEFLVDQYRREAWCHAVGFLGNSADAEDACQEAFAKAYSQMPKLTSLPRFYPWFYVILKNQCLNRLRNRKSVQQLESAIALDAAQDPAPATQTDPRLVIEGDNAQQSVWQTLNRLKAEFREILILRHLHEAGYAEISELLGIPRGTVMSRLYHARQAFSEVYERAYGSASDALLDREIRQQESAEIRRQP